MNSKILTSVTVNISVDFDNRSIKLGVNLASVNQCLETFVPEDILSVSNILK